jgi:hypothetical protein
MAGFRETRTTSSAARPREGHWAQKDAGDQCRSGKVPPCLKCQVVEILARAPVLLPIRRNLQLLQLPVDIVFGEYRAHAPLPGYHGKVKHGFRGNTSGQ